MPTDPTSVIWKYPLADAGEELITIPAGAELLHVGLDPSLQLCVWAACDPEAERVERRILCRDTGDALLGSALQTAARFVGTVQRGELMIHVLDLGEPALDPGPSLDRFDAMRRGETPGPDEDLAGRIEQHLAAPEEERYRATASGLRSMAVLAALEAWAIVRVQPNPMLPGVMGRTDPLVLDDADALIEALAERGFQIEEARSDG